ncbi:MAG TPA: SDR family NAD(P)-dependent oxidoreductase [Albitalea sp.]|jgi:NAD(P)-dependent dehydrogenase (short-subunit alcohol dehydrogenase family)|nr:SDR family NAD(P)-dependent oxidoreductase [Albitalea sp.]
MSKNSTSRVALVTGAARGLGQGFTARLAADGHRVIAVDRIDCAETLAIVKAQGGEASQVLLDLSDANAVEQGAAAIIEQHGPVDILVNNAGIIPNVEFEKIDLAAWRALMAINLEAPFLLCRGLIPSMKKRGYGRIVNIASNTVGLKIPGFVHYVTSKSGLIGMTRALASEFGPHGITVNAVAPGLTRTHGMMDPNRRGPGGATTDEEISFLSQLQAIPRGGEVADLVGVTSFLASDDAGFMTGQTLVVDGGLWRL